MSSVPAGNFYEGSKAASVVDSLNGQVSTREPNPHSHYVESRTHHYCKHNFTQGLFDYQGYALPTHFDFGVPSCSFTEKYVRKVFTILRSYWVFLGFAENLKQRVDD